MDLKEFIEQFDIEPAEAVEFFINRDWFGSKPEAKGGRIILTAEQVEVYTFHLTKYLKKANSDDLLAEIKTQFCDTARVVKLFFKKTTVPEDARFYLLDFLLTHLFKEIVFYSNEEIEALLNMAAIEMTHTHAELLTFLLAFVRTKRRTRYNKDYGMKTRKMENNDAYSFDEFIEIIYHLYNEKYIEENDMYAKAAKSKNYADTWLFLSLPLICALRMTDLERIYHPILPKEPQEVLDEIENGTFSDVEAREVLLSITRRLCMLPLTPNKTKKSSNIPNIKFVIPHSCEVHIGTLFALAEAHQQISGEEGPLVRRISTFEEITRNMGEDIGDIFLKCNFRTRKAHKSYMQGFETLAGDILGEEGIHVKGYMLAALARSHKSGYGVFAATAATYLKDAAFSGLTPEFVSFELFERGVLSFIPSMLLQIITDGDYGMLDVHAQTQAVKSLGLTPREIENVVAIVDRSQKQARDAIASAISEDMPVLEVLHNIASGRAFSKQPECMCLLSAVYKSCPNDSMQCIGCNYEISTKSTFYLLTGEYRRMAGLYTTTDNQMEKAKFEKIIGTVIVPKLEEILIQIKSTYGEEVYEDYCEMVRRYVK